MRCPCHSAVAVRRAWAEKRSPRGTQLPVRQFVNGPQLLPDPTAQLERIQTRLLSLESRQRLGLSPSPEACTRASGLCAAS